MAQQAEDLQAAFSILLQDVELIIDNVKDIKNEALPENFSLHTFWTTLDGIVKSISMQCTKLCMAFNEPPIPTAKECEPITTALKNCLFALAASFHTFPMCHGKLLQDLTRDSIISVMRSAHSLIAVIKEEGGQGFQRQRSSTGNVWECCNSFAGWPTDNQKAVLSRCTETYRLVSDALEEIEEAHKEETVDTNEVDDMPGMDEDPMEIPLSKEDMVYCAPCLGLLKASKNCVKKLSSAVRSNGCVDSIAAVVQLDELAERLKPLSPAVDDLASELYPPLDVHAVKQNAEILIHTLTNLLESARQSHYTSESEEKWVEFLLKVVLHNQQKIEDGS